MLRRCAEKVDRLISIDCSSPMSASTWSKTGSAASAAGGRRPAWWSTRGEAERLQRDGLAARVRAADDERAQPAEVEVDRHGGRRVEQRMPRRRAAAPRRRPRPPRRASGARAPRSASARSSAPVASTSASSSAARSPTERESSRRIRSTSSRSALAASASRLFSSTIANGSTNSVWPEPDESWTTPRHLRRAPTSSPPAPAGRRAR